VDVNPSKTAVVLIEYQNDFTSDGGALHGAVKDVMDDTGMLANSQRVMDEARRAGATIIHAPISFAPGYGELGKPEKVYGILKGVIDSNAFVKGTWGAEICDQMTPQEGDIIVEGKRGLDAFATTNLDFVLRSNDIETVILGGFLTNCCVESTMRSAYERGYDVITLTDCTAATSSEEQTVATSRDYPMFSQPMTSSEAMDALQGAAMADSTRGY
jgi:nicotinamidase-related amidase